MKLEPQKPNYAIRVMVFKNGRILLGKNKSIYGGNYYSFPGGKLEYMESFEHCAKREVTEECGIELKNIAFHSVVNRIEVIENTSFHNVHITLTADWKSGEPKVLEPEKCDSWDWYELNSLPKPLFKNCEITLQNYTSGKKYFDITD